MQEEYEIIDSPLSQMISRDGMTVEVLIYRGKDDSGWILEVVDQEGGSTCLGRPALDGGGGARRAL